MQWQSQLRLLRGSEAEGQREGRSVRAHTHAAYQGGCHFVDIHRASIIGIKEFEGGAATKGTSGHKWWW